MIITICVSDSVLDATARLFDAPEIIVQRKLHRLLASVRDDDLKGVELLLALLDFQGEGPGLMDYNGDIE